MYTKDGFEMDPVTGCVCGAEHHSFILFTFAAGIRTSQVVSIGLEVRTHRESKRNNHQF